MLYVYAILGPKKKTENKQTHFRKIPTHFL